MQRLDFLIIGAQKAGTTSLRAFFDAVPDEIFILKSEQHFWNREGQYKDGFGVADYLNLFSEAKPKQIVAEKSPNYLSSFDAPARIARHFPQIKLIALLRNPIERSYSAYWHGRRVGAIDANSSFSENIRRYRENHGKPYGDVITAGLYSRHIDRFTEFFPLEQLLILDFQKVLTSPETELPRSLRFLGISEDSIAAINSSKFPKRNTARLSRFPRTSRKIHSTRLLSYSTKSKLLRNLLKEGDIPPMKMSDREFLAEIYSGEAEKIELRTGVKFEWQI